MRCPWAVNIDYRYAVDGVTHDSHGHYVGNPANEAEAHLQASGPFAVGRDLRVYYDPLQPHESRLAAGRNYLRIVLMSVGAAIFLSPIYIVVDGLRPTT